MTLHSDYLKLRDELRKVEQELSYRSPDSSLTIDVHPEGIRLETRSPSGASDIVHSLYLKTNQAKLLAEYINKTFGITEIK